MKRHIKNAIERLIGSSVSSQRGIDRFRDLTRDAPQYEPEIMFDVGANIGQTARLFREKFPNSTIYSFEPFPSTYKTLCRNVKGDTRIHTFALALGAANNPNVRMKIAPQHDMNSLASDDDEDGLHVLVPVLTLDTFCEQNTISKIDYLKIDAEGGDLNVLKGGERMLSGHHVAALEVEAGMNKTNEHHVPLEALKLHLEERDYFLFGIYEQVHEWPTKRPYLRRSNALFISARM